MSKHVCEPCGESFETLSRKRLHQKQDCPGQFEQIGTDGMDQDDIVEETVRGLVTCQQCERRHDGSFTRGDDYTNAGYSVEIRFTCDHCGFNNVNTAILEGLR